MYVSTATSPMVTPGSTSTRRALRLLVSRLHGHYLNLVMRHRATRLLVGRSHWLAVRPVTTYRGTTTHHLDCTSSTAPMLCIRTRRLAARLLVGRSHWLSPCVRSLRLAARLLIVRIAPALPRLCRASGRAVSTLDFSSVGRTGSRRASGH
jgi:hypothetical protein